MSLDQAALRRLLRKGLGNLDSDDLSNDECDEMLNISLWEIEDQFPFEIKETVYTTTLVVDQYEYDLGGISELDAIVSLSYIDEQGKRYVLDRMTRKQYDDLFDDGSETAISGKPEKYIREGNVLTIWPPVETELDGNTLTLALKESVESIGSTGTGLPRNWDQIVLQGAIAFGHNINQDYDLRDKAENFKLSKIRATVTTESKEEEDSRYAGLDVAWDRPDGK
jgi:hypothetical protein